MRLVEKLRRIAAPAAMARRSSADRAAIPGRRVGEGYWIHRSRFPLRHRHGERSLEEIRTAAVARLAAVARDPRLCGLDLDRAIFFDTETTSLGGGAGTYVFLLGAGYFEPDAFVVEQYFLRELADERALLEAINRRLGAFDLAVSFHGKGFDTPRLADRFAFHGMRLGLPDVHLDLCQVGRSLYRGAFGDCRLQTFERELVSFHRADDLPGSECPQAFFSHMHGDSSLIPRVFEHNLYDILTLPAVAACFAHEVGAPRHPVVLSNLGAFYESVGRDRDARAIYGVALEGLRHARHLHLSRTLERLALLERRAGRHRESAHLLVERRDTRPFAFHPLEDLAKYYEHRARDLPRAEETVLGARSWLMTGKIQVDLPTRERYLRAIDHRLGRLRRRIDRSC